MRMNVLILWITSAAMLGCQTAHLSSSAPTQSTSPNRDIDNDIESLRSTSPSVRADAQARLIAQGDRAIPALLAALRVEGIRAQVADEILPRHSSPEKYLVPELIRIVDNPDEDAWARRAATTALGRIGHGARAALPVLLRILVAEGNLPDPAIERRAQGERTLQRAIVGIGSDAAIPVANLLRSPDPRVRIDAAWILQHLGKATAPAIALLSIGLEDPWPQVRLSVAQLLMAYDSIPSDIATVVLSLREDPHPGVREAIQAVIAKLRLREGSR